MREQIIKALATFTGQQGSESPSKYEKKAKRNKRYSVWHRLVISYWLFLELVENIRSSIAMFENVCRSATIITTNAYLKTKGDSTKISEWQKTTINIIKKQTTDLKKKI